ncbi:MAG: DNA mismatch repair endonuclease MutL, partial [Chitinophagales bacterium]
PASAVKELLENAIDAGGTKIQLIVKDAGKTLIQVVDNGCGMSETDARLSFERHATSKIKNVNDLFAINTFGFRGEALASIAAVAQVELKTRQKDQTLGTRLVIHGSQVQVQEPCNCAIGTSFSIKNLFYNVPARRNFLKSPPVEMRHIIDEFQRVVLANPQIQFSLHNNNVEVFHLPSSNLRRRIVNVFGHNFNKRLVPLGEETDFLRIYGFIGKPKYARKTRGEQYFFVNDRFIKSSYLNHAVLTAYEEVLQPKTFPLYVVFIDIDPIRIDVNVHPTKQEIKFDDEKVVYTFLNAAVKRSLGAYCVTPTIDFDQEVNLGFPINQVPKPSKRLENFSTNTPFSSNASTKVKTSEGKRNKSEDSHTIRIDKSATQKDYIPTNWMDLYKTHDIKVDVSKETTLPRSNVQEIPTEQNSSPRTITIESDFSQEAKGGALGFEQQQSEQTRCQIHRTYILTQIKSGFILVHQQLAHERVLYEGFWQRFNGIKASTQTLLFPRNISLSNADAVLLKEIMPEIKALGYHIEAVKQNKFTIHGVPADLSQAGNEEQSIEHLIEQYKLNLNELKLDKRESLVRTMARSNAVKTGEKLNKQEMQNLIDQLFACEKPFVAPNGKPTFVTYALDDIQKRFDIRR